MNEIFRGKNTLDGSWVEGHHVSEQKDGNAVHYILMYDGTGFTWKLIDTETLSKCTGAKDRNKNLIWENDIIKFDDKLFIVEYDERFAMYVLRNAFSGVVANGMCFALSHCQVVGNRFDNSEMISIKKSDELAEDFPMLNKLEKALEAEYFQMSEDETVQLHQEIRKVVSGEAVCSNRKKNIANDMSQQVSDYYHYHIEGNG